MNGIGHKQTAGLEATLARVNLANVSDLSRFDRETVERRLDFGVWVVAVDVDEHVADTPTLAFFNVVHELQPTFLLEEDRFSADVGENVALAAVEFLEPGDIGIHAVLFERLRTGRQRTEVMVRFDERVGARSGIGLQIDALSK